MVQFPDPNVPWRILLKYTEVEGRVPTSDILKAGELALNIKDGKVYTLNTDGQVIKVGQNYDPIIEALLLKISSLEKRIQSLEDK